MAINLFENMPLILRKRAAEIPIGVSDIVRKISSVIHREVVYNTPADTGKARSNWLVSLNAPITAEIPPYAPGSKLGIGERANAQAAISQGQSAIRNFNVKSSISINISNNVGYIGKLNAGSSQQSPAAFVERAIQSGMVSVKGAKIFKR